MERLATPVAREICDWGAQMRHPIDGAQLGLGAFGQHMYIDAATNTVLIKLAESPEYETDKVWEFDVLHEIARRGAPVERITEGGVMPLVRDQYGAELQTD